MLATSNNSTASCYVRQYQTHHGAAVASYLCYDARQLAYPSPAISHSLHNTTNSTINSMGCLSCTAPCVTNTKGDNIESTQGGLRCTRKGCTWQVVDVSTIQQQVPVSGVAEGGHVPRQRHGGAYVAPCAPCGTTRPLVLRLSAQHSPHTHTNKFLNSSASIQMYLNWNKICLLFYTED